MKDPVKFWNKMAKKHSGMERKLGKTYQIMTAKTSKQLNKEMKVLDYGCATGSITVHMAEHVKEITGIDFSSEMIEVAKASLNKNNLTNINFTHAELNSPEFQPETYDAILAFNLVHLLDKPEEYISRICNLLKPGGYFISSTPCVGEGNKLIIKLTSFAGKFGLIPRIKYFKIPELKELIERGNFTMIEEEQISSDPCDYFIVAKK